jgi:FKBP-type peptidyl-prolyl cis-trans isomerase FkpA
MSDEAAIQGISRLVTGGIMTVLSRQSSTGSFALSSCSHVSPFAVAMLTTALLMSSSFGAIADTAPKTDDEKAFYSIGAGFAENLKSLNPVSSREIEVMIQGIRDGVADKGLAVDQQQGSGLIRAMAEQRQSAANELEKRAAVDFIAAEAKKSGAKTTESGLVYTVLTAGTGESPGATDTVRVHYHGTLRDGKVFDSSVQRGEPAEFPLNKVIPCWTEGVALMKQGGKSRLVCPSSIAYGDRATGSIPGGAALAFEVELLEIVR